MGQALLSIMILKSRQTLSICTQKMLTFTDSISILHRNDSPQPGPSRAPLSRAPSITPSIAPSQMTLMTMKHNPTFLTGRAGAMSLNLVVPTVQEGTFCTFLSGWGLLSQF